MTTVTQTKKKYFIKCKGGIFSAVTLKDGTDEGKYISDCAAKGIKVLRAKSSRPTQSTLERYSDDGVCKATDGCRVEPDGVCVHGHPSWLMALGYI